MLPFTFQLWREKVVVSPPDWPVFHRGKISCKTLGKPFDFPSPCFHLGNGLLPPRASVSPRKMMHATAKCVCSSQVLQNSELHPHGGKFHTDNSPETQPLPHSALNIPSPTGPTGKTSHFSRGNRRPWYGLHQKWPPKANVFIHGVLST